MTSTDIGTLKSHLKELEAIYMKQINHYIDRCARLEEALREAKNILFEVDMDLGMELTNHHITEINKGRIKDFLAKYDSVIK